MLQIPSAPNSQTASWKTTEVLPGETASLSPGDVERPERQARLRACPEQVGSVTCKTEHMDEQLQLSCLVPLLFMVKQQLKEAGLGTEYTI